MNLLGYVGRRLRGKGRPENRPVAAHKLAVTVNGSRRIIHETWYRGEVCNFHPARSDLKRPDAIEAFVGHGWLPEHPFITKSHRITAFGSCFAANITKYLVAHGFDVSGKDMRADSYIIRCGEGMVNTAAILQQFKWAYGEVEFDQDLWHDKAGNSAPYSEDVRQATRMILDETDVFILTLGLSEVWYDVVSGDIFWRTIPKSAYNPRRHSFKVMSVAETKAHLSGILEIIRRERPSATVIVTLSPVPLAATFRPVSCITANSVSKAVLRVAIDEFVRENSNDAGLYYFPSFEIVTDYVEDPFENDMRHPRQSVIAEIMGLFHRRFLIG